MARGARTERPGRPVLFATGHAGLSALAGTGEDRIVQRPFREAGPRREVACCLAEARGSQEAPSGRDAAVAG